jgi:fatty acid desaturase
VQVDRDPRLALVDWRPLARLRPWEAARELLLPWPWLLLSWAAAERGRILAALPASFLFFLSSLRVVHDAQHHNLGLSRRGHDLVMALQGSLMLGAIHAQRVVHLRHHRLLLGPGDVEGASARGSAVRALWSGPLFPARVLTSGWRHAQWRARRWIALELLASCAFALAALSSDVAFLRYHVLAMLAGHGLAAFFCVWTVHHACEASPSRSRTLRARAPDAVSYGMFRHVEHHLFPKVPTLRLAELGRRLDRVAPELAAERVFARGRGASAPALGRLEAQERAAAGAWRRGPHVRRRGLP